VSRLNSDRYLAGFFMFLFKTLPEVHETDSFSGVIIEKNIVMIQTKHSGA